MKIIAIAAAAALASCAQPGQVNSASTTAAHVCTGAARAGAAADLIAQALVVAGVSQAKIDAIVPLIQAGKLLIDVNCAILAPPVQP